MTTVDFFSDRYDANSILASGLKGALLPIGRFQLSFISTPLEDLLSHLRRTLPDVLLLDLRPEAVADVLRSIRETAPRCKPVLWVEDVTTEMAFQAMSQGVRGILRKCLPVAMLMTCLESVRDGGLWFEKDLTDRLLGAKRVLLTPREGQLVTLLSHGLKNKEIATALRITEGTVKVYLSRLYQKVGVQDRFELALFALRNSVGGQMPITQADGQALVIRGVESIMLQRSVSPESDRPALSGVPQPVAIVANRSAENPVSAVL